MVPWAMCAMVGWFSVSIDVVLGVIVTQPFLCKPSAMLGQSSWMATTTYRTPNYIVNILHKPVLGFVPSYAGGVER